MKNKNNDISDTIAVLALILAILGLVIAAVSPVLGPLTGLVLVAFLGGGAASVWADRRFLRRDGARPERL
jgi:membrane protein implicated in regulation of membrane protease activity